MLNLKRACLSTSNVNFNDESENFEDVKIRLRQFQWDIQKLFLDLGLARHGPKCCCAGCSKFRRLEEENISYSVPSVNGKWYDSWCAYGSGEMQDSLKDENSEKPKRKKMKSNEC
jgi:hypothetical protein